MGSENSTSTPDGKHTLSLIIVIFFFYIIVIIFSLMTVHMMRLLSRPRVAPPLAATRRRCFAKSICLRDESARWQAG